MPTYQDLVRVRESGINLVIHEKQLSYMASPVTAFDPVNNMVIYADNEIHVRHWLEKNGIKILTESNKSKIYLT